MLPLLFYFILEEKKLTVFLAQSLIQDHITVVKRKNENFEFINVIFKVFINQRTKEFSSSLEERGKLKDKSSL